MAESFLRHSPLAHLGLAGRAAAEGAAAVVMCEQPFRGIVNLRGNAGEELFDAAVETALGLALPVAPNTAAAKGDLSVLWLGPDEWWVVTSGEGRALADKLRTALTGQHAAVTEVGESRTAIRLAGPRARATLAKGCPLDLHPRNFTAGRCAQSHCAKALVTLHQVSDKDAEGGPVYDLYVLNSFADYLWRWLEDAAREYGVAVAAG